MLAYYNAITLFSGIMVIALVSFDVFQTIIVPHSTSRNLRIGPFLIGKILWKIHKAITLSLPKKWQFVSFELFAPASFVIVVMTWFLLLILGYALILLTLGQQIAPAVHNLAEAFYFAGTCVLTLGFGEVVAKTDVARLVVLSAAMLGIVFIALTVSFLFTLQTYLQTREQVVNTLTSRAGSPGSGIVLLMRYRELNIVPSLANSFVHWESWVANILESHSAYNLLIYFRSSNHHNSWTSSLGAILDASTLISTVIDDTSIGEAELFYWLGLHTIKSICTYIQQKPDMNVQITKAEFSEALELLKFVGYKVKAVDDCWETFKSKRSGYMRYLAPVAKEFALPMQSWIYLLPINEREKTAAAN